MKLTSVENLLVNELRDLLSAEKQLIKALPKMAKAASSSALQGAFKEHLEETKEHVTRLEKALKMMDGPSTAKTCEAMKGLIKEGEEVIEADGEDSVRDAALIMGAQKVEHYEIASYGSVCTIAELLGEDDVAELLKETLSEEKETDEKLTELAETEINAEAAAA